MNLKNIDRFNFFHGYSDREAIGLNYFVCVKSIPHGQEYFVDTIKTGN